MTPDVTTQSDASRAEVMSSVDVTPTQSEFVIADVTCDDAWLSIRTTEAPLLEEWA